MASLVGVSNFSGLPAIANMPRQLGNGLGIPTQVWYFVSAIPIPDSVHYVVPFISPPFLPDALKLRSVFEGKIFGLIFRRRRKENGEQEEGREGRMCGL